MLTLCMSRQQTPVADGWELRGLDAGASSRKPNWCRHCRSRVPKRDLERSLERGTMDQIGCEDPIPLGLLAAVRPVLGHSLEPDMMHIVGNLMAQHIFPLYCGKRNPSTPKPRKTWTAKDNQELMKNHATEIKLHDSWQVSPAFKRSCTKHL